MTQPSDVHRNTVKISPTWADGAFQIPDLHHGGWQNKRGGEYVINTDERGYKNKENWEAAVLQKNNSSVGATECRKTKEDGQKFPQPFSKRELQHFKIVQFLIISSIVIPNIFQLKIVQFSIIFSTSIPNIFHFHRGRDRLTQQTQHQGFVRCGRDESTTCFGKRCTAVLAERICGGRTTWYTRRQTYLAVISRVFYAR